MVFPYEKAAVEAIFPYRSKETNQLEADLLQIYVDPAPFWSLENDILLAMFHRKTDYFKLLKNSSTFKKDTYFRFDVTIENVKNEFGLGPATFIYTYKGYDFNEHN